jgi:adenylate cyclase, class 2
MHFTNIEIKARTKQAAFIRQWLMEHHAEFRGTDHQTDTYFNVPHGRMKIRQGNIENALIRYQRPDESGPKQSDFDLLELSDAGSLKQILSSALGIKVVVEKKREIFFIENTKFHLDELPVLGSFVEIEASNKTHPYSLEKLGEQCSYYQQQFRIEDIDLVNVSYSDLLLSNYLA